MNIFLFSQTSMMLLRAKVPYYEDSTVQVVKLPYIGGEVEMVIILPKIRFGLLKIRETMTGKHLIEYIQNAKQTDVEVSYKVSFFQTN